MHVCECVCVKERSISSGAPLEDNKHFKGSLRDTERDICLKTRGLSADPPLFSLRLASRQSKMSFSLTLFWWICSPVCLLKSTTEDLANELWALWIKQQGRREVVRKKPRSVWAFQEQRGTEGNVIGADSGSRQPPVREEKARWLCSEGLLAFHQRGSILSGALTRKACVAFNLLQWSQLLPCCILFYHDRF